MAYRMRVFYQRKAERRAAQFLRECHLCKRTLGEGDDIFMYKGDTPFCSEECRQEQIDLDEAMERAWHTARAMRDKSKAPLPEEQEERRSTNSRSDRIRVPNGTVAVA